jgi:hypothetical protein
VHWRTGGQERDFAASVGPVNEAVKEVYTLQLLDDAHAWQASQFQQTRERLACDASGVQTRVRTASLQIDVGSTGTTRWRGGYHDALAAQGPSFCVDI